MGGSFAFGGERCDYSKCKESNPSDELEDVRYMPNAQQLREYCPKILRFLDCNIGTVQSCVGQSISDLAASSNQSVAEEVAALLGVGSLVRDLCNPHSTLHKDYVANIECFRGFIVVGTRLCTLEARETLDDFYAKSNIEVGGLDDALNAEIRCLKMGFEVTCLSMRLGESCGESAQSAFVTVVRRLKGLMESQCEGGQSALKTKLYNYMEVDDEKMSKMKETFELFRRRR
ncbi:hypothetical protein AVEN_141974-1 [Araneus ventricosus]|uniref:Uncharacterized protein n=1 Tax=Araneus ventricosus TaxID=182803 RepID=A0A4Y2EDU3_ARAVE|nr:hypothetical protein AVEN_141974-1 [Araneus ventricosus]